MRRALQQVLALRDGEEVEAGSPVIIEGEVACGVDLVPYFKGLSMLMLLQTIS